MAQRGSDGVPRALDAARRPRAAKPASQRRRDILDAAAGLFGERGFDATTVQAIASEAGVAAGTVYLHFPSKEAVLSALQEDYEAGLLECFARISADVVAEEVAGGHTLSHSEVIERLIDGLVDYSLLRRTVTEVIARSVARVPLTPAAPGVADELTKLLSEVMREGVRLGHIHVSDPDIEARLLTVMAVSGIAHAIVHEDERALARVVSAIKELFIKALAPTAASPP